MSARKIALFVFGGVLAAAVLCVIVGVCVYVPALGNADAQEKTKYLQIGMLMIVVGCSCMILSLVALSGTLIAGKLIKNQNNQTE